ncbi:MAG: 30S ribosomal protein S1 [Rickettsiales bacterium]|jgi:small subunit ribosomal protein S1|nr:30S ribosomal protein S1 [Rickettsiales bacterium]
MKKSNKNLNEKNIKLNDIYVDDSVAAPAWQSTEDFASLLENTPSLSESCRLQNCVTKGTVIKVEKDTITVDVGLKSEGRIARREFGLEEVNIGDIVDIFVDKYENADGTVLLSREKARREEVWEKMEALVNASTPITGKILERVKGGFSVDVDGLLAFMPGSQIDVKPIKDLNTLVGTEMEVVILKMDKLRMNIIVSHRAISEKEIMSQRASVIGTMQVGAVVKGTVKNITDYGAFVDLGGIDALLHITDISWKRISNPATVLSVGQEIDVKIINLDSKTGRVSLGIKQLTDDPWDKFSGGIKVGEKISGTISSIADYGAFVSLNGDIEGLIHVSEFSWTKKNINPNKVLTIGQEVEVVVLEIDREKRRISLGLKQCTTNPWIEFSEKYHVGDIAEGEIKGITEFGLFVEFAGEISGMVHLSDLSWDRAGEEVIKEYNKGDMVKVKILDIDLEKERVALGVKQLVGGNKEGSKSEASSSGSRDSSISASVRKGSIQTCVVREVGDAGIIVDVNGAEGFIKKSDIAKERSEQNTGKYAAGDKVDAKVMSVEADGKVALSIKALEIEEQKKVLKEYGSTETGAVLGDILGLAMEKKKKK